MPAFRCRLKVAPHTPVGDDQLKALKERPDTTARRQDGHVLVTLPMDGGDIAGALIRAQNTVLDLVPGRIDYAEVDASDDGKPARKTWRRRRR